MQRRQFVFAIAILALLAGAALAGRTVRRRSLATCTVTPDTGLSGIALPTSAELVRLVADARMRFTASAAAESPRGRRFGQRMAELERALGDGTADQRCRVHGAARAALQDLSDDPATAPQRSSIALVLDLTAASIARASMSPSDR